MTLELCPLCKGKRTANKIIGRKLKVVNCPKCNGAGSVFAKEPTMNDNYTTWFCNCCEGKFKTSNSHNMSPERCPYCRSTSEIHNL